MWKQKYVNNASLRSAEFLASMAQIF